MSLKLRMILRRFIVPSCFPGVNEKLMHTWAFWIGPENFLVKDHI